MSPAPTPLYLYGAKTWGVHGKKDKDSKVNLAPCIQPPFLTLPNNPFSPHVEAHAFHTSWLYGHPWLKFQHGVMHGEARCTYPRVGAQLEWISGIQKCKRANMDKQ